MWYQVLITKTLAATVVFHEEQLALWCFKVIMCCHHYGHQGSFSYKYVSLLVTRGVNVIEC